MVLLAAHGAGRRDCGLFFCCLSTRRFPPARLRSSVFFSIRLSLAFTSLALRYPVKKWAALAAAARSLAYLVISGTSFATVRSFIMISIMFLAIRLARPATALRNVALSALIILVLFPENLPDVGFQMSFAAVIALVSAYDMLRVWFGELRAEAYGWLALAGVFLGGIILSTIVASVAVTPFAIYHSHKTRHFAVLANRVAVSICNVVVTPEALPTLVLMP